MKPLLAWIAIFVFALALSACPGPEVPAPAEPAPAAPAPDAPAPAAPAPAAPALPEAPPAPAPSPQAAAPATSAGPPAAPAAPAAAATGDPAEHEKAARLARIIVSDVVLYNPEKFEAAVAAGNVHEALEADLAEGRVLLAQRIDAQVRAQTDFLADELVRVARERGMQ